MPPPSRSASSVSCAASASASAVPRSLSVTARSVLTPASCTESVDPESSVRRTSASRSSFDCTCDVARPPSVEAELICCVKREVMESSVGRIACRQQRLATLSGRLPRSTVVAQEVDADCLDVSAYLDTRIWQRLDRRVNPREQGPSFDER